MNFFPFFLCIAGIFSLSEGFADQTTIPTTMHLIDFNKIFLSAPLIYSFLSFLSITSLAIWIYSLVSIRKSEMTPRAFSSQIRSLLVSRQYAQAEEFCRQDSSLLASLVQAGLATRTFGHGAMIDSIKAEGKRVATPFWQRLSLLNDIVVVAPMIGLLGTVMGMFYAFYDVNRSVESINTLFDGLGIAVATTVSGLIVAILSMLFSTTLKYRLVRAMSILENESVSLSSQIEVESR